MTAAEILADLVARGAARSVEPRAEASSAVVVAGIEIAVVDLVDERRMRSRWRERVGTTATSYVLISDNPGVEEVSVLGPSSADAPVRILRPAAIVDTLAAASGMPQLHGVRFLAAEFDRLDLAGIPGVRSRGLLTPHTLDSRFRGNSDRWVAARTVADSITDTSDWQSILRDLGYDLSRRPGRGWLARSAGRPVAVVHPKADPSEFARLGQDGRPMEGILIADCHADGARYGIMTHRGRFRVFDAGSPSAAAKWLDIDASQLGAEDLAFLGLVAPDYLARGGLEALQEEAHAFGARLRARLDHTIRQDALPALSRGVGVWASREGLDITDAELRAELEKASLTLLFRILFILYAESAGHLPMTHPAYRKRSLSALAEEAAATIDRLSDRAVTLWSGYRTLVRAIRSGDPGRDVPAYNGALFAAEGFEGSELLERVEIADADFAEVLVATGRDPDTGAGFDYSTLEIGHLGHIYEALLSLRLSVADQPLRYDDSVDRYVADSRSPDVASGDLLWQTNAGGRKSGGVYYTPTTLVRHLVRHAVLPAFERHLDQVRADADSDTAAATRRLLDFAVVDPACGSAHFLVEVMDALAERTVLFLADTPLPPVADAIEELRAGATAGIHIDDVSLLRRLILKHCVYGVDVSPMGAEVATISLWLASFVPGLSLAYLGRNIIVGNSLIGVARPDAIRPPEPERRPSRIGAPAPTEMGESTAMLQDQLDEALAAATASLAALAASPDRTPDEHDASRAADQAARAATAGLARVYNLWTAEGFGLTGARVEVQVRGAEIIADESPDTPDGLLSRSAQLSTRHRFLHWPLEFPQVFSRARPGFDVVVGNPPWEEVTVERLAFLALHRPGLRSLPERDRERAIQDLLAEQPDLESQLEHAQEEARQAREALATGEYDRMRGDPDLYKYFCQRYRTLLRDDGLLGVVLSRSAFINDGSEGFRHWLFETNTTERLDFLLNKRKWVFDTHPQWTIALVVAERAAPPADHRVTIAGTATTPAEWERQAASDGLRIAQHAFGPRWITPLLRSQTEADVLAMVRRGNPFPLGSGGRWRCFPVAELHETSDKHLWEGAPRGRPLWKGESFDQYDPHGDEARLCPTSDEVWNKVRGPRLRPGAKSMLADTVPLAERRRVLTDQVEAARVAFRDVSRANDSRTMRACLVPPKVFLTNKAPYLAFVEGDDRARAACLGVMNSLPFDWQTRRFVEINLNFFLLEGFVVPDLSDEDYGVIAEAAARLSATDERFAEFADSVGVEVGPLSEEERDRLRVEIDARVARSWDLSVDDLEVMFADFTTDAVPQDYRTALSERLSELR